MSILIIITSILLVLVILIQNPKGGGLSSSFVGGAGNQIMGAKKTTDFLEKSTWYLVVALFISCIIAGVYNGNRDANVGIDESFLPSTTAPVAAPIETEGPSEIAAPIETSAPEEGAE